MPIMKAPEGVTSFSIQGVMLQIQEGYCDVPVEFIDTAMSHGFTVAETASYENVETTRPRVGRPRKDQ